MNRHSCEAFITIHKTNKYSRSLRGSASFIGIKFSIGRSRSVDKPAHMFNQKHEDFEHAQHPPNCGRVTNLLLSTPPSRSVGTPKHLETVLCLLCVLYYCPYHCNCIVRFWDYVLFLRIVLLSRTLSSFFVWGS